MALWPNNFMDIRGFSPVFLDGNAPFKMVQQRTTRNLAFFANETIEETASIPEGSFESRSCILPPLVGGGMSSANSESAVAMTSIANVLAGGPMSGTGAVELTAGVPSLSLVVSIAGGSTFSLTGDNAVSALTIALAGATTLALSGDGSVLTILSPITGLATITFSGTSDLRGLISMSGEFSSTDAPVTVDYGGAVYVAEWGEDDLSYPAGTATFPVKTMAVANIIASKYALRTYHISGVYVLEAAHTHSEFIGWGPVQFCSIDLANQPINECRFRGLTIYGQLNTTTVGGVGWQASLAKVEFDRCFLHEVTDLQGVLKDCQIEGATLVKAGGWVSATGIVIEGDFTVFDFQSTTGTTVSMDVVSGWAQLSNMVAGCLVELNMKGGEVSFLDTCLGGDYYLEGIGTLFDESGGALTKKENHFVWDEAAAYHVEAGSTGEKMNDAGSASNPWTEVIESGYTAAQILRIIAAEVAGKTTGAGTTNMKFTGLDGSTVRIDGTLDAQGNRTAVVIDPN